MPARLCSCPRLCRRTQLHGFPAIIAFPERTHDVCVYNLRVSMFANVWRLYFQRGTCDLEEYTSFMHGASASAASARGTPFIYSGKKKEVQHKINMCWRLLHMHKCSSYSRSYRIHRSSSANIQRIISACCQKHIRQQSSRSY